MTAAVGTAPLAWQDEPYAAASLRTGVLAEHRRRIVS